MRKKKRTNRRGEKKKKTKRKTYLDFMLAGGEGGAAVAVITAASQGGDECESDEVQRIRVGFVLLGEGGGEGEGDANIFVFHLPCIFDHFFCSVHIFINFSINMSLITIREMQLLVQCLRHPTGYYSLLSVMR